MTIPAEAYLEHEWLVREHASWFGRNLFVDLSAALKDTGSIRAFSVADKSYFVRRGEHGLNAYDNTCLHRGMQLFPEGYAHGHIRCGYHGWKYRDDGSLIKSPSPLNEFKLTRDCLSVYPVSEAHGLVWATLNHEAGTADRDYAEHLAAIPVARSTSFYKSTLPHRANWKLLVENVIEGYHLSYVHGDSFVPTGYATTSPVQWGSGTFGSWSVTQPRSDSSQRALGGADRAYRHLHLFPNLFLSVTNGLVIYVAHFHPTSAAETELHFELLATPLLLSQKAAIVQHVQNEAIAFTNKVLREDLAVLEASQKGMRAARRAHQAQVQWEPRILHFHEEYMRVLQ